MRAQDRGIGEVAGLQDEGASSGLRSDLEPTGTGRCGCASGHVEGAEVDVGCGMSDVGWAWARRFGWWLVTKEAGVEAVEFFGGAGINSRVVRGSVLVSTMRQIHVGQAGGVGVADIAGLDGGDRGGRTWPCRLCMVWPARSMRMSMWSAST